MYVEEDLFTLPPLGRSIYRYMPFERQLLGNSALWFSRSDFLGDPLEGGFTDEDVSIRETAFSGWPVGLRLVTIY